MKHEYVVQYNIAGDATDDESWHVRPGTSPSWFDVSADDFSFDPEDAMSMLVALEAAKALQKYVDYQEQSSEDPFMVHRIVHRTTTERVVE